MLGQMLGVFSSGLLADRYSLNNNNFKIVKVRLIQFNHYPNLILVPSLFGQPLTSWAGL